MKRVERIERLFHEVATPLRETVGFIRAHPVVYIVIAVSFIAIRQPLRLFPSSTMDPAEMEQMMFYAQLSWITHTLLIGTLLFCGTHAIIQLLRGNDTLLPSPLLRIAGNVIFFFALFYAYLQILLYTVSWPIMRVMTLVHDLLGTPFETSRIYIVFPYPGDLLTLAFHCLAGCAFVGAAAGDEVSFKTACTMVKRSFGPLLMTGILWLKLHFWFKTILLSLAESPPIPFLWGFQITSALYSAFFVVVISIWYERLRIQHQAAQAALVADADYGQCQD